MKRIVVDTNVLLSFLTQRDPQQQDLAATLFGQAALGTMELVIHQTVLTEMVYVLGNLYEIAEEETTGVVEDLLALPGVLPADSVSWARVLGLWPRQFPDLTDAVLASVAKAERYDAIATFDRRLARQLRREGLESYWQ